MTETEVSRGQQEAAERALRDSEARFRAVADSAPVLIWTTGTDKQCNWVNRVWLEFTGRTIEQELGEGWTQGVHPDDRQRCLEAYGAHFDHREPFTIEYRLRRHDGEHRWMIGSGTPYVDASGRFAGYVGSDIDITDRRRAEEAVRESEARSRRSEEKLRLALAASSQAEWEYDVQRDLTILGPDWKTITGHPAEACSTLEGWLQLVHPEERERCRAAMQRCIQGEAEWTWTGSTRCRSGWSRRRGSPRSGPSLPASPTRSTTR